MIRMHCSVFINGIAWERFVLKLAAAFLDVDVWQTSRFFPNSRVRFWILQGLAPFCIVCTSKTPFVLHVVLSLNCLLFFDPFADQFVVKTFTIGRPIATAICSPTQHRNWKAYTIDSDLALS